MKYDAIIVLGGGVRGGSKVPEWVEKRIEKAIELYKKQNNAYIIATSAYTVHKRPFLDKMGFPLTDADAIASILVSNGIQPKKILREMFSRDTVGNAFFTRIMHTDIVNLGRLCIITSDFHMRRARKIFDWIFSLSPRAIKYQIDFCATENTGLDVDEIKARAEREKEGVEKIRKLPGSIKTLKDFHHWFFTEHKAYSLNGQIEKLSDKLLESY